MEEQCQQKSSIFFVFSLFFFAALKKFHSPLSLSLTLSLVFSLHVLHHFPPVLKNIHSGAFIILCLAQQLFKDCSLTLAWRAELLQSVETWNVEKLCIFEFWCPHLPPAAVSQRGWKLWMLCGQSQPPLTLELMIALTVGGRHVTCLFFFFFLVPAPASQNLH